MSRVDPPSRRFSALVVDDDPGLQGLFLTLLGRHGFAVDCAPNGRVAYEYLRRNTYSVIFLDLMMPDVNGFELLERIGRESPSILSRVIVVTGAAQPLVDEVDTRKIWALLRKPFDLDHLVTEFRNCANAVSPRAPAPASPRPPDPRNPVTP
jgi:DNA-binding response OmpR family regulator